MRSSILLVLLALLEPASCLLVGSPALRAVAAIQEQTGVDIPIRSMMVEPLGAIATRIAVGSAEVETPPDDAGPESRSWLSRFRSKR